MTHPDNGSLGHREALLLRAQAIKARMLEVQDRLISIEAEKNRARSSDHGPDSALEKEFRALTEELTQLREVMSHFHRRLEGGSGRDDSKSDEVAVGVESPDLEAFRKQLFEADDDVEEIALKPAQAWTEAEQRQVADRIHLLPTSDPRRDELDEMRAKWFSHFYGDDPVRFDDTGRMMSPQPKSPIPKEVQPVTTSAGVPLQAGLERVEKMVQTHANNGRVASPVRNLQAGLNLLAQADLESPSKPAGKRKALVLIKEDGDFGPQTRAKLKQTLADLGAPKVAEAFSLGQFKDFLRSGSPDPRSLSEAAEKAFGPLFRKPGIRTLENSWRPEGEALQATLNDVGAEVFGDGAWEPLREDGWIGPKTASAFVKCAKASGPDHLAHRYGWYLGFL